MVSARPVSYTHLDVYKRQTMVTSNYVFVQNGKTQPQPDKTTSSTAASLTFQVRDPNVASRLANAFKHAIEVCGGKASAF